MELASDVFCFTMADDSIFAFAGLWEQWRNPAGQLVETCSIITTTPNALCADVHDRMPVILPDEAYDLWLDPGFQTRDTVCPPAEAIRPGVDAALRSEQQGELGEERCCGVRGASGECGCGECLRMASNRLEFAKSNDGLWTPTNLIPLS